MASLRWAISASALETLAAARAAAASALAAFVSGVNARDALGGKEPLEVFQIVGRPFVRHHDRKWSTDRAIRDLGIDKMSHECHRIIPLLQAAMCAADVSSQCPPTYRRAAPA